MARTYLKLPEGDDEAGKLDEAEEVVGVIFPADEDAPLPLVHGAVAASSFAIKSATTSFPPIKSSRSGLFLSVL